jgi:RNA polymerase sigma factor (sigma-70 family)
MPILRGGPQEPVQELPRAVSLSPMTENPPDSLQRLLDEAPFVRLLARDLLASEQDEVVQQTWLQAVRHGGAGIDVPRSWLARIVQRVANNLRRRRDRRHRHEAEAAGDGLVPSSAELCAHEEQRRQLVAAVDRLPKELRTVVLLRYFDGQPPRQIAAELGVPVATVWNRLRRALQLLRERLDAEHGGERSAWTVALTPFAMGTREAAAAKVAGTATVTLGLGVLAMTLKAKLAAAVVVFVTLAGAVLLWQRNDGLPAEPPREVAALEGSVPATGDLRGARGAVEPAMDPIRSSAAIPVSTTTTTGSLVVHVRHADDKTPAAGVTMILIPPNTNSRFSGLRQVTDASGTVRFADLAPGPRVVRSDRGFAKPVEVAAGTVTEFDCELGPGVTITGIVVDTTDVPVAGALVEVGWLTLDADAEVLAESGPDGRFRIRNAPTEALVGARAEGHSASPLQFLIGRRGNHNEVRIQLGAPAGGVEGTVVDQQGRPVSGAVVRVGAGKSCGISPELDGAPPFPALVRTDSQGHFHAIGVPIGSQPVLAYSAEHAPWQGTCEVTAHLTARIHIELPAGATIRGIVRDRDGAAVAKAQVEIGRDQDFANFRTGTDSSGHFEMAGLPAGDLQVEARHREAGMGKQLVTTSASTAARCDLVLSRGEELRGRMVDEAGQPVAGVWLSCRTPTAPGWSGGATTRADGTFSVPNCPAASSVFIDMREPGIEMQRQIPADPRKSPIVLRVRRSRPPSVHVTGILHDPDGNPLQGALVMAATQHFADSNGITVTNAEGRFAHGPLVPGKWTFLVHAKGFPGWSSEPRELGDGAAWDLGTIALPRGGRAVLAIEGDQTDLMCIAHDSADNFVEFELDTGQNPTAHLVPGDYRLVLRSKSVAAQSIPFVVREGETTQVPVKLGTGIRQAFEFESRNGIPAWTQLTIRRGKELLTTAPVSQRDAQSGTGEVCLLPGDYRVLVSTEDRELASAPFTVGTTEGPPLRIVLQ